MKENPRKRAEITLKSAQTALRGLSQSVPGLLKALALVKKREGEIVVTGIGKSGAIAEKIAATLTSLGHRAIFLHPADALHGDIGALRSGDVILALSYSGESKEVVKLVEYASKHFKVPVIGLTKSARSSLGKLSDVVVEVKVNDEGSPENLAPMASTTAMLVLGDMLASMLTGDGFKRHFAKAHPGGGLGLLLLTASDVMKSDRAVPRVSESDRVSEVLKEMSEKKLGVTAVVDEKGVLRGVITDGDVRRWLLKGGNPATDTASRMMTKSPKSIRETETLKQTLRTMEDHRITTIFVTDSRSKLAGIVHIHDIVEGAVV